MGCRLDKETYHIDLELDVRNYSCPVPVFRLNQAVSKMNVGQNIKVLATDPATKKDFESWTQRKGYKILNFSEENGVFTYIIQRIA